MTNKKILTILQVLHLLVIISAIGIISLLHINTKNFWDFLRLPQLISDINPFLGNAWPASLHVYQVILVFAIGVASINALGLVLYKSKIWRIASDVSSFIGFLIFWPVSLFLIFILATVEGLDSQNIQTIFVYYVYTQFIFVLDLITWFVDERNFAKHIGHTK